MSVDPKLKAALQKHFGVSERHVNRLITERSQALALPREQAAISLALDSGVNVTRIASPEDLADIRHARLGTTQPIVDPVSRPQRAASTVGSVAKRPARVSRRTSASGSARTGGKRVWVVYGRNEAVRRELFSFLRALGLTPVEFGSAIKLTKSGAPYVGQILDEAFKSVQAVVVLLTGDDDARLKQSFRKKNDPEFESRLTAQPRPNVLFEAGMAFGHHPNNTIVVQQGSLRQFSDILGRHVIRLSNSPETRSELANRLASAGCAVDMTGPDWLSVGNLGS